MIPVRFIICIRLDSKIGSELDFITNQVDAKYWECFPIMDYHKILFI